MVIRFCGRMWELRTSKYHFHAAGLMGSLHDQIRWLARFTGMVLQAPLMHSADNVLCSVPDCTKDAQRGKIMLLDPLLTMRF